MGECENEIMYLVCNINKTVCRTLPHLFLLPFSCLFLFFSVIFLVSSSSLPLLLLLFLFFYFSPHLLSSPPLLTSSLRLLSSSPFVSLRLSPSPHLPIYRAGNGVARRKERLAHSTLRYPFPSRREEGLSLHSGDDGQRKTTTRTARGTET